MFLDYLKNFLTRKIVRNSIINVNHTTPGATIQTVGILFDESYFYEKDAMVEELVHHGIEESNIRILVFKDKIKKKETFDYPTFCHKDLSWTATFEKSEVKDFIAQKFDLLINYYDTEKSALLLASNQSPAGFKVGFSSVDKKLNHLSITTHAENYKVFIEEVFKYLKILNKI